jgi:1,4-dihydroxy-2-naphthoate octaprenyltransferase
MSVNKVIVIYILDSLILSVSYRILSVNVCFANQTTDHDQDQAREQKRTAMKQPAPAQ